MNEDSNKDGLLNFIEKERNRILDACIDCGRCIEVCAMAPYLEIKSKDGRQIVANVLNILKKENLCVDEPIVRDALTWTMGCIGSGACISECPENVNPKMMLRIARITALGGLPDTEKLTNRPEDPNWFPRVRAFARTQLSSKEQEEWM